MDATTFGGSTRREIRGVQSWRACLQIQLSYLHLILPMVLGAMALTALGTPSIAAAVVVGFGVPCSLAGFFVHRWPYVRVSDEEITVRNLFRSRTVARSDVTGIGSYTFSLGKGDICPALLTRERHGLVGRQVPVIALYDQPPEVVSRLLRP